MVSGRTVLHALDQTKLCEEHTEELNKHVAMQKAHSNVYDPLQSDRYCALSP